MVIFHCYVSLPEGSLFHMVTVLPTYHLQCLEMHQKCRMPKNWVCLKYLKRPIAGLYIPLRYRIILPLYPSRSLLYPNVSPHIWVLPTHREANFSEAMKIAVYPTGDPHFLMAMLMWKMSSVFKNPPSFHHTGWFIRIPKFPDRIEIFPIEILYNHRSHQQDSGHCCLSKPSQFGPVENFSASSAPSISILVMSSTHILKRCWDAPESVELLAPLW